MLSALGKYDSDGIPMLAPSLLGRYGPYGPPFADPELQATFLDEVKKLASNALITESTAKDLIASVMNSALAAGKSAVPEIRAEVEKEATVAAYSAASRGARAGVGKLFGQAFLTVTLASAIGLGVWALGKK